MLDGSSHLRFASARRPRETDLLPLAEGRNHVTNNFAHHGFDEPQRCAVEVPEDVAGALTALAEPVAPTPRQALAREAYFEIYRTDRVNLTSILFSGGDWRWRFYASDGKPVASGAGYVTERACMNAVAALRAGAGSARVRQQDCR